MAIGHLEYNRGTRHGNDLDLLLRSLETGLDGLVDLLAILAQMIDGDGSQAAHFTYVTEKFGFPDDATAKAAWDELNSLASKLTTDGSVSNVNAALLQAFHKFG